MTDTAELIAGLKYEAVNCDWGQPVLAVMLRWAADALSSLVRERDEARADNERDRSIIIDARNAIHDAIVRRSWLLSGGRGYYEWDDDRWREEFGAAIDEIGKPLEILERLGVNWVNCPTDHASIVEARIDWKARATAAEAERDEAREAAYDQPHGPTSRILWSTRYRELLDDYKDTEQVVRLTRERDDALVTISLLQSQHRKQQEHDTAIIEGLTRDVNRYAYERDTAREERDKAERQSEAFWKPQVEAAEAKVSRLLAANVDAIAIAVLAEREACAGIAERHAEDDPGKDIEICRECGEFIAFTIRCRS